MARINTVDLFCQVIDNFGDIGVCWRLARSLANEHALSVTLWVDDLRSFGWICHDVDVELPLQVIQDVRVVHWSDKDKDLPVPLGDLVIEAFGCRLPESVLSHMVSRSESPVWINLEYLSAENWVEGCHKLASPHPSLPLKKYFFFPGFTLQTGGILLERHIAEERNAFQCDLACSRMFLTTLTGALIPEENLVISLFCYADAPISALLQRWENQSKPMTCIVPDGVAPDAISSWLGRSAIAGTHVRRGALEVRVVPFIEQENYDRLLWACDLNFVRGEDSFVRAQWAQRPFVWQIYPQAEQAHLVKLDAFLTRYVEGLSQLDASLVRHVWHQWNSSADHGTSMDWWPSFAAALPTLRNYGHTWSERLSYNGDLAANLIDFAEKIS